MAITRREVVRSLRLGPRDAATIANRIYRAQSAEYRDTLLELSERYGEPRKTVVLSRSIRVALRRASRDHARKIVATFNADLDREAKARGQLPGVMLLDHLRGWADERNVKRARFIARNELAIARLDAEVSFYVENGVDVAFDFKGPRAKCEVCKRLKARGPWPLAVVLAIGHPHIGCTHGWRARTRSAAKLRAGGLRPGRISAGRGSVAGIVGGQALVGRFGTQEEAANYLDGIRLDG